MKRYARMARDATIAGIRVAFAPSIFVHGNLWRHCVEPFLPVPDPEVVAARTEEEEREVRRSEAERRYAAERGLWEGADVSPIVRRQMLNRAHYEYLRALRDLG